MRLVNSLVSSKILKPLIIRQQISPLDRQRTQKTESKIGARSAETCRMKKTSTTQHNTFASNHTPINHSIERSYKDKELQKIFEKNRPSVRPDHVLFSHFLHKHVNRQICVVFISRLHISIRKKNAPSHLYLFPFFLFGLACDFRI